MDLLVGYYNGRVSLFECTNTQPFTFELKSKNAWGARGNEWRKDVQPQEWKAFGYASPRIHDVNGDGKVELMVGTAYGYTRLYNINGHPFTDSLFADTSWFYQKNFADSTLPSLGSRIIPAFAELTGDTLMEVVFGLGRGGLNWASSLSAPKPVIGTKNISTLNLKLFPNPCDQTVQILRGNGAVGALNIKMYNIHQQEIYSTHLSPNEPGVGIPTDQLSNGVYFVNVDNENGKNQQLKLLVKH
jgi:hypothetical protein